MRERTTVGTTTDRQIVRRRNRVEREYGTLLLRADALTRAYSGLTGLPDTEQTDQYREAADALAARRAMLQAQLIALQAERLALRER